MPGFIDALMILLTPDAKKHWYPGFGSHFPDGVRLETYIERMDQAGVELALLAANGGEGPPRWRVPVELVEAVIDRHPDRFNGLLGVNPLGGAEAAQELEEAVTGRGFVGACFYPHWFSMPPNDPRLEPFYEKCVELDIPFMSQGCASFYSYLPAWVNRPLLWEEPLMRHPELRVVLFHGGWPWVEEAVMMTRRFPNCYLMPSVLHPASNWVNEWDPTMVFPCWGPTLTDYARTVGAGKLIYGSNFPVTDPVAQIRELRSLSLGGDAEARILRQNALRVFRL